MTIAPCILTASGRMFWPLDPHPEDVHLDDIVDGLANICRFGGQAKPRYSVAQHSVLVSYLAPRRHALWGLMHDAAEALSGFGDIVKPVKQQLMVLVPHPDGGSYRSIEFVETRILEVIAEALTTDSAKADFPWPPPDISKYDEMALNIERNALMPDHEDWPKKPGFSLDRIPRDARMHHPRPPEAVGPGRRRLTDRGELYCWEPTLAASIFMDRYTELRGI